MKCSQASRKLYGVASKAFLLVFAFSIALSASYANATPIRLSSPGRFLAQNSSAPVTPATIVSPSSSAVSKKAVQSEGSSSISTQSLKSSSASSDSDKDLTPRSSDAGAQASQQQLTSQQTVSSLSVPLSEEKKWNLYAGIDYSHQFYREEDQMIDYGATFIYQLENSLLYTGIGFASNTNLVSSYPQQYGWSDWGFTWVKPNFAGFQLGRVPVSTDFTASVALPTSTISQQAGTYFTSSASVSAKVTAFKKLLLIGRTGLVFSQHQYNTSNAYGTAWNSPYGLNFGISARYPIFKGALLSTGYTYYPFWDYSGRLDRVESWNVMAQYYFSQNNSIAATYRWKDKMLTNQPVFALSNSIFSLGIEIGI